MEIYHTPGVISRNQIDGKAGRQMTLSGNSGPAFIMRWNGDEQPALAWYRNNKEEVVHG
jgi:hypothetical protein